MTQLSTPSTTRTSETERFARWTILFVALGIAWRLLRYALKFPVWGDEAALLLNLTRATSYKDLLLPLQHAQVAPFGFLAAEFTSIRLLGTSEYALRLFPLLTGIAAILLFAPLAQAALGPRGGAIALGILIATHYATRYSLDIKPYGTDLLASATLLLSAVRYLRSPRQSHWLVLLILETPVALIFSYPAIFVLGAIALGLFPTIVRFPNHRFLYLIFLFVIGSVFFATLHWITTDQYAHASNDMLWYWSRAFPPANPFKFLFWLVNVHTAEMMSYPIGGKNGASTLTFLLCLVGVPRLLKRRDASLLLMLLYIFAFTLLAAALRRYPYGGSARVEQHLAPAICILAAAGIESLVDFFHDSNPRRPALTIILIALTTLTLGGTLRDFLHPYQTPDDQKVRQIFSQLTPRLHFDDKIILFDDHIPIAENIQWYLQQSASQAHVPILHWPPHPSELASSSSFWTINLEANRQASREIQSILGSGNTHCYQFEEANYQLSHSLPDKLGAVVQVIHWKCVEPLGSTTKLKEN